MLDINYNERLRQYHSNEIAISPRIKNDKYSVLPRFNSTDSNRHLDHIMFIRSAVYGSIAGLLFSW